METVAVVADQQPIPEPPVGRDAEKAAVMKPSFAATMPPRRRGTSMGSRMAVSKNKEPVYPQFVQIARSCQSIDTFWSHFFESMATGRLPRSVTMRDDSLIYRSRKTVTALQLTEEVCSDWQNIADFFRKNCNILSSRDWELRAQQQEEANIVVELTTAQINKRTKKARTNAIPEFVLALKAKHSLTHAEMAIVESLLRHYITSNMFAPGDVVYTANNAIREVKTLVFNEATRTFSVTREAKATKTSAKEPYQDVISYLSSPPFTKVSEKGMDIDKMIKKQLELLYGKSATASTAAPSRSRAQATGGAAARKQQAAASAAMTVVPGRLLPEKKTVTFAEDDEKLGVMIMISDDDEAPENSSAAGLRRQQQSDSD